MKSSLFIFVALTLSTAGCGATQSTQDGGKEGGSCSPGKQINCGCSVGRGVQVCKDDGTGYGACMCGDGGMVDGGKDGARDSTIMESGPGESGDAPTDTSKKETGGQDGGTCTIEGGVDAGPGGELNWAKNYGKTVRTFPTSVAIDPTSGAIATAGYFNGTTTFGGGLLDSGCALDSSTCSSTYVAVFDSGGGYKWAKAFKSSANLIGANGVAIDSSGNVAIGGIFQGSVSFGGGTLTAVGDDDIFIAEFDSTGKYVWSKSFGSAGQSEGIDTVSTDSSGHVIFTGDATSLDFGGGPMTGFYIAKFDSTGAYSWSNAFAAMSTLGYPVLTVDSSDNMILAGSFATTVDFGGGTLTSAGLATDAFVAKFDSSGTYVWAKQYGDAIGADIRGVAVDPCGDIFVSGDFGGSINFGSGTLTNTGAGNDVFLAKLTGAGSGLWSNGFVGPAEPQVLSANSVAGDGLGGATITNFLTNGAAVDYGGGTLTGSGSASVAVASFNSVGAYRWAYVGGSPSTALESVPGDPLGVAGSGTAVVIVGQFNGCAGICAKSPPGTTLVLDGTTLTAVSGSDMFLASFVP